VQVLCQVSVMGATLPVPHSAAAHPGFVALMERCLSREACQRPGFHDVLIKLEGLVEGD
jgi:hypothetical protein